MRAVFCRAGPWYPGDKDGGRALKPHPLASALALTAMACIYACSNGDSTTQSNPGQGGAAGSGAGASGTGGAAGAIGGFGGSAAGSSGTGAQAGEGDSGTSEAGPEAGFDSGLQHGIEGPSCAGGLVCAYGGVSCCESNLIPGGTFPMGRGTEDCGTAGCQAGAGNEGCPTNCYCTSEEQPEHPVKVADFFLDTYEVTVGRFRKFVDAYTGVHPASGAGAHPLIAGSGWQSPAWDAHLPADKAALITNIKCDVAMKTWTDTPGSNELFPMNCVNWYEAFAFCIWDGGYLPTEAEWEYAAAGGDANRLYPWGSDDPSIKDFYANDYYSDKSPMVGVGTFPAGRARWGQLDLAGSMYEWAIDWYDSAWYSGAGANCDNCANLTEAVDRVFRGGDYFQYADRLRSAFRVGHAPVTRANSVGFRCARSK